MKFEGEHLWLGSTGHFFVILAFIAAILSTIGYITASFKPDGPDKRSWIQFSRYAFFIQSASVAIIFAAIFYICSNHYFEFMYAYKHASKELESKYLLACIWEGQEGSFLLWTIWHCVLGIIIIFKAKEWEAPVMTVVGLVQFFLLMMILGIYFFGVKIGNSPFTLTRNEIAGPIFSQPNYLTFIKDGVGLNVLLRNYWMVIHPPVLFLGFATTIIPFAYAYAGMQTKRFGEWVKPALPWALISACVLGTGIMMGGKWAYESLSFGGYWAWDPVENASLVPWMILVAGLHTMVIYKATGNSLRASYIFAILGFVFVLYSTFLTRTGILGDTSVHAFTEAGNAMNIMILSLLGIFTLPPLILFFFNIKRIPAEHHEEKINSREFWMFIGALVMFMAAMFIIAKTSVPVYNKVLGTQIAPPENVEFSYNKVIVMVAIIIGLLTAVAQYFKYKQTPSANFWRKIVMPTLVASVITAICAIFFPITFYKEGPGFLGAIYVAFFAAVYSAVANAAYIWTGLNGKLRSAGGSITHLGFALLLIGIIVSSGNKQVISDNRVTGLDLPFRADPKQKEDLNENLTLVRDMPTRLGEYQVTYNKTSATSEKEKTLYHLSFEKKKADKTVSEKFTLEPEVYVGKEGMKASNPDTRHYLSRDIFTYISFVPAPNSNVDTTQFTVFDMGEGDTVYFKNGFFILNKVNTKRNEQASNAAFPDAELVADLTYTSADSSHYTAHPKLKLDSLGVYATDDTLFAKNIFVRFAGVADGHKIKVGLKSSDSLIDFITLKAYIFPWINLVWIGLIVMTLGLLLSTIQKFKVRAAYAAVLLIAVGSALFYMFLLAS
ncbi:MAG: cytochrome c biogenesis protein CcsA [Chitinophagaceae bacterium]